MDATALLLFQVPVTMSSITDDNHLQIDIEACTIEPDGSVTVDGSMDPDKYERFIPASRPSTQGRRPSYLPPLTYTPDSTLGPRAGWLSVQGSRTKIAFTLAEHSDFHAKAYDNHAHPLVSGTLGKADTVEQGHEQETATDPSK